jgi:hypothetical protein
MNIDYIITGDFEELSSIMGSVLKESRFLSDKPNVKSFVWYPIDTQTQCVEISMTRKIPRSEMEFLTREYQSITVGILKEGILDSLVSIGETEEVQ